MKVIVTGAAGFIGSHIAIELARQGHDVLAVDDLSGGNINNLVDNHVIISNLEFQRRDIRNETEVMSMFYDFRPDVVYHLAANAREGASFFQPQSIMTRNVMAYTNVLKNAIKYKTKRIILFSSIAVYGHQDPPFVETMPRQPADLYGLAKATMEEMTEMMATCHKFDYVILRPHNVYGEKQALNDIHRNVLAIWMNKIMRGEQLIVYGDGTQERAFSYIGDSLPCYIEAMNAPSGKIYNIGSSMPCSINGAAMFVKEAMGVEPLYPVRFLPFRHQEVKYAYSSHDLAAEELGLNDATSLYDGVRRMAAWAKSVGPQEWKGGDKLELTNERTPEVWV